MSLSVAPTLRSVDCVGPLLVLREAGGVAADFEGNAVDDVELGLDHRTTVLAAGNAAILAQAVDSIRLGPSTAARA